MADPSSRRIVPNVFVCLCVCVCVCVWVSDEIQQSPSTPMIGRSNRPDYEKNTLEKDNSALVIMNNVSKKN